MADEAPDKEQKTLDPTAKRLEDAYKKGQIPISKDLNNFIFLFGCLGVVVWCLPFCFHQSMKFLATFISMSCELSVDTPEQTGFLFKNLLLKMLKVLWIPFLVLI